MNKLEKRLDAVFLVLLLGVYGYWALTTARSADVTGLNGLTIASALISMLVCLLFGLLGVAAIGATLSSWRGQIEISIKDEMGRRSRFGGHRHDIITMAFAVLIVRLLVFAVAYILYTRQAGSYQGGMFDTLHIWLKGDAPHYLGIAENWYTTQGDPRFHIVFFPLYPICVRLLNLLLHNAFAAGIFTSLLFTVGAGVLLYELALMDMDRGAAKRAVRFQMLLPAAFFLSAPMSDGLFLFLSLACMLFARKKRYALACLVGFLASFTRVLGVVLLAPVAVELFGELTRNRMQGKSVKKFLALNLPCLLLIPMGLALYVYVNYQVTGNAFTFLTYQSEHWNQNMGLIFNTASYQTNYFLNTIAIDRPAALGLWLPNLLYLIGAPVCVLLAQRPRKVVPPVRHKKEDRNIVAPVAQMREPLRQTYTFRASYTVYFLAYYFVGMGATWLLSAPRYLTCCFALPLALAARERPRWVTVMLYFVLAAMQIAYLGAYVSGWPVY